MMPPSVRAAAVHELGFSHPDYAYSAHVADRLWANSILPDHAKKPAGPSNLTLQCSHTTGRPLLCSFQCPLAKSLRRNLFVDSTATTLVDYICSAVRSASSAYLAYFPNRLRGESFAPVSSLERYPWV